MELFKYFRRTIVALQIVMEKYLKSSIARCALFSGLWTISQQFFDSGRREGVSCFELVHVSFYPRQQPDLGGIFIIVDHYKVSNHGVRR